MAVSDFSIKISFILLFTAVETIQGRAPGAGPFRAMIASVKTCEKPSYPYMKDPPIFINAKVHNSSNTIILNCNFSVFEEIKNVKFRMKSFVWTNNKWRPNYMMNDIGCNGVLLQYLLLAVGIKYDKEKCVYIKGNYQMYNLDVNAIQHIWASKMEYGKMIWRSEFYKPQLGTFSCIEFYTVSEPA